MPTVLLYFSKREKRVAMQHTLHIVLYGCSSQQQAIAALKAQQGFPSSTRRILDVLRFIEDHVLPFHASEVLLILQDLEKC